MSRLREVLLENRAVGTPSLGIFTTTGYPSEMDTVKVLDAIADGGADFIELGLPFSDPLAEGETIQRSSAGALAAGVCMRDAFAVARAFRARHDTPLVFMGYVNPVLAYGIGNFFSDAASSGVNAVILPDLPPEEAEPIHAEAARHGVDLVMLIAPTTPDERIERIDALSDGFVYAVSVTGLTGSAVDAGLVTSYLDRARKHVTRNPLMVGFGISSPEDVIRLSGHADGCIVGSAFIRKLESLRNEPELGASEHMEGVRAFVSGLKQSGGTAPSI